MYFRMLYDDKLAQAAYLIGCQRTGEAIIIDPERDVDRYIQAAESEGLRISAIAETHIHADFLSGARELAERTGARLYLSDEGDADWKYLWLDKKEGGGSYDHQLLHDGDVIKVGNIRIQAVHTPGHTPEHLSYFVTDAGGGATQPMGVATGDFVFVGDVGRPDLLETAAGVAGAKEKSARVLFDSIQKFKAYPDYLQLWPGHGAGSACGKALGAVPQSTVGYEKMFNASVNIATEKDAFVRQITYGQPEPPLYFARMKKENKEGPALLGQMPKPGATAPEAVLEAAARGAVILDTRPWEDYVRGHLAGALHAPLDVSFPTVAGSFVAADQAIYLVAAEDRVTEAVTDLIRIGLDNIVGYTTPEALAAAEQRGNGLQTTKTRDIADLKEIGFDTGAVILDVRRADEFDEGHLPGAINIAHTRLMARMQELPAERPIWVHCRTSNRSAYASAFLQKNGFDVTMLDGGYVDWLQAQGEIVKEEST